MPEIPDYNARDVAARAGENFDLLDVVRHLQSKTGWHGRVPVGAAHPAAAMEPPT